MRSTSATCPGPSCLTQRAPATFTARGAGQPSTATSSTWSYEDIDSIINQANELGTHVFIYTGGEPLVRKADLIRLCDAHPDSAFLCFTNATLIDRDFVEEVARVKNFIPIISAEGSEETTDARRGEGTYQKIDRAMDLLKARGIPFGVSICYTSQNADAVCTEEYYDWLIDKGVFFAWIFTYMPVGRDSPAELMPSPQQREMLYDFNHAMRHEKPLLTLDFQNDGEFVGGCIAGGRRYLHINASGDVEPLRVHSLLECQHPRRELA